MNRNFSIRTLSLFFALAIGVYVLLSNYFFSFHFSWVYNCAFALFSFVLFFLVFSNWLKYFINTRIKPLYKVLYPDKRERERNLERLNLQHDIVGGVKEEVDQWTQKNLTELEQLKKQENFRREFLGNVSHELKTPIFSIQGYIHTLLEGGLEDEHINILYLEKAARSVERLSSMVGDLEAISRLESGELILELRNFDILELVKEVYDSLEFKAKVRNILLGFKEGSDRSFFVNADKDRIRQVIVNLVVNSIKYGKTGGRTQASFFDLGDNLLVEISDDGIGIEEQHLSRLFERFYRVDKSRSREQGGTGLGLSIVKHIIEAHGQGITVRSKAGEGTTFSFTLKKD